MSTVNNKLDERLGELYKYTEDDFNHWFINGFKGYYDSDYKKRFLAFDPLNAYIGLTEDLTKELGYLYAHLKGENVKIKFKKALAKTFNDLLTHESDAPILRSIMFLTSYLKIRELIIPIVNAAEKGFYSVQNNNINIELFVIAMDVVCHLSERPYSGDNIRRLVQSNYFKSIYAPKVFISLCKSEPERYPEHLKLLKNDFFKIHKRSLKNIHITANRFILYVRLEIIAKYFDQISLSEDNQPNDNWLIAELFRGDDSLLFYEKINSFWYICSRKTGEKHCVISDRNRLFICLAFYSYQIDKEKRSPRMQKYKKEYPIEFKYIDRL